MAPGWRTRAVLGEGGRRRIHDRGWVPTTGSRALRADVLRLGLAGLLRPTVLAMLWRLLRPRKATSSWWCGVCDVSVGAWACDVLLLA